MPEGFGFPLPWRQTARAFAAAVESGRLDLPLPGSGATWERVAAFADLAGEDLSLARLGEGHADAVAILAELGGPPPDPGSRWGVWAANPPGPNVTAEPRRRHLDADGARNSTARGRGSARTPWSPRPPTTARGCSPSTVEDLEPQRR